MNYSIGDFWKAKINAKPAEPLKSLRGWSFHTPSLNTFTEAPLSASEDFDPDQDPEKAEIILVAAPGAVGKSTLARQIASETNAIYIDLSEADAVGGTTLSGSLARSGMWDGWKQNSVAVLIDGLDEARLRVTQEGFEDFLKDVGEISVGRSSPTVLFGRTGAIGDAWLVLGETDAKIAVLEIGYYGAEEAAQFAETQLRSIDPDLSHQVPQREAIELILSRLRERTEGDRGRFAGYAPVLSAVAERVARAANPASLIAEIERGGQPVTLKSVVSSIMERERQKLSTLAFEDSGLGSRLYGEAEQLRRLVARRYGLAPPAMADMGAHDSQIYAAALETWVPEHPFLNGNEGASAVFDAVIVNAALSNSDASKIALEAEIAKGASANPFLSEFFLDSESLSPLKIAPELVGVIYASVRAQLSLGQSASLSVEALDSDDELEALSVTVEIAIEKREGIQPHIIQLESEQVGTFRLGSYVDDVDVTLPEGNVEIGPGAESILVAPVSIQCRKLSIRTSKVAIEGIPGSLNGVVSLEADDFEGAVTTIPTLRGGVTLSAFWPNVRQHPWTAFAGNPTIVDDVRISEGLRRLRKFIIAFRSHSKGALKRYRAKLDHARMTKGTGQAILDKLIVENVLSVDGPMYVLDPNRLADVVDTNYAAAMSQNYSNGTVGFVRKTI